MNSSGTAPSKVYQETIPTNTVEPQQNEHHKCQFCRQVVNKDRKPIRREVTGRDEQGNKVYETFTETEFCCTGTMLKEVSSGVGHIGRRNPHQTVMGRKVKLIPTAPGYRGTGQASRSPQLAQTRRTRIAMATKSRRANWGA